MTQDEFQAQVLAYMGRMDSSVTEIRDDLRDVKRDVSQLKNQMGRLDSNVAALRKDMAQVKEDMHGLHNELQHLGQES